MYIVTFYSFKGGVGRSMALVNIGIELAKEGKRVLFVDFDLEAPGLPTFEILKPQTTKYKGLIDYVCEYKQNYEAPDVREYLYKVNTLNKVSGDVWVMPAGMPSEEYGEKLTSVNWGELYESYNGFLLFEDLKEQWKTTINPDYVFIDSRTGYTDVAGICTRQLPNAVCLLFFPNDQNLLGIENIVSDIRSNPISQGTVIHFVMSNVPDMDDEDNILANRMHTFERKLGYSKSVTIHHYANLALLNQEVFTLTRPNSRLAKEYRELSNQIRSQNADDREASLRFLKSAFGHFGELETYSDRQKYLDHVAEIEKAHINDPEIDFYLARFKQAIGDVEESLALLDRSIANGSRIGSVYINRSVLLVHANREEEAYDYLVQAFSNPEVSFTYLDVMRGLRLSQRKDLMGLTEKLITSPAVTKLTPSDQAMVAYDLMDSLTGSILAEKLILNALTVSDLELKTKGNLEFNLVFSYVAQAKLTAALEILERNQKEISPDIPDTYNLGFAYYWAGHREKSLPYFQRVVNLHNASLERSGDSNYLQCLSFAHWALGDRAHAYKYLSEARKSSNQAENRIFSTWRYYKVLPNVFKQDLEKMQQLYGGENVVPAFMQQSKLI